MLPLWGGTTKNWHKKIQAVINKTARCVTGKGRRASTSSLMAETGWMTSRELTNYSTLTETWRNVRLKTPAYMAGEQVLDEENLILVNPTRLQMTRASYKWRARFLWNTTNDDMRSCESLQAYKKLTRKWIKEQRPDLQEQLDGNNQLNDHPSQTT